MKLTIVAIACLLIMVAPSSAQPRNIQSQVGGRCPIGTCAANGGETAKDIKYCSAKNCKKPVSGPSTHK